MDEIKKLFNEHSSLLISIAVVFTMIIVIKFASESFVPLSGRKPDQIMLKNNTSPIDPFLGYSMNEKSTFVPLSGQKLDRTVLKGVDKPENQGAEHHGGYGRRGGWGGYGRRGWGGGFHRAYVPGIYAGYIPDLDLAPIIPNGLPQCIDGDPLRPCWTINNGSLVIRQ